MHRRLGRSKERFAVLAMGRNVMTRILGALLATALSVLVLVCMGFAGAYQYLAPEIPDAASLRDVKTQLPLRVYTRDGKLMAQIGEQRRIPVAFDEIPPVVIDAFLAAEDARFFEHPGVDWQSLVRALVANVSRGQRPRGRRHDHDAARAQYRADVGENPAAQAEGSVPRDAARA